MNDHLESDSVTPESRGKTVTLTGFVYEVDFGYGDREYRFFTSERMGDAHYTLVGPAAFAYQVPADFNPTASKLAALEAAKAQARAEYLARVREIEEQIGRLQALEMRVEAA